MKFKTIYIDVTKREELHHDFDSRDGAFFIPMHQVETMFEEIRPITDHLSFSLFNDANEHPNLGEIFNLAYEHGFRYDVMFLSNKFIDNLALYKDNNAISHIEICMEAFEVSRSMDSVHKSNQLKEAILTLIQYKHRITIDLPSRNIEDYQSSTLSFMNDIGFNLEEEDWKNGNQLSLNDYVTIRCCERIKEPMHELLPQKILGRCHGAVTMLGIMGDGTVIPCNNERGKRIVFGNIFATPIIEILSIEPFLSISDGFYKNQLVHPVCQHCPYPRKIF